MRGNYARFAYATLRLLDGLPTDWFWLKFDVTATALSVNTLIRNNILHVRSHYRKIY